MAIKKSYYPMVHHYLIDVSESEHTLDQDWPHLREELGYDPRCFRPLAVMATLGLMRDEWLPTICNNLHEVREEIFLRTKGVIESFDTLPPFPNFKPHHMDLICRYISYAVVDIGRHIHRRIRQDMALESAGSVECSLTISPYYQAQDKDQVALQFTIDLVNPARFPFPIRIPEKVSEELKGENKW